MDSSPQGLGTESEVGWKEDFTCPLPAMICHRGGGQHDDNALEHGSGGTVRGASSKLQACREGWGGVFATWLGLWHLKRFCHVAGPMAEPAHPLLPRKLHGPS